MTADQAIITQIQHKIAVKFSRSNGRWSAKSLVGSQYMIGTGLNPIDAVENCMKRIQKEAV